MSLSRFKFMISFGVSVFIVTVVCSERSPNNRSCFWCNDFVFYCLSVCLRQYMRFPMAMHDDEVKMSWIRVVSSAVHAR